MENIGLALANLFLGLSFFLYAKYNWRVSTPISLIKNNVTWLYLSISISCLFSFIMYGFYNLPDGEIHNIVEQIILLSSSFIFYFLLTIIFTLHMPSKPRKARALSLIPAIIYALLTFQWSNFAYIDCIMIPVIGILGYHMYKMYHLNKNKQLLFGIVGLFFLSTLSLLQNYFVTVENPFFFLIYIPLTLLSSMGMYRGLGLYIQYINKTGIYNVMGNNLLNHLTSTSLFQIFYPKTIEELQESFKQVKNHSRTVSFQSKGYSIGRQHLIENGILIDAKKMNKVEFFDSVNGLIKVGPSMSWHQLLSYLNRAQKDNPNAWMPKQIPNHFLDYSIAGSVSANSHGNNLLCPPLIKDIEAIDILGFPGESQRIHRKANNELFRLVVGGYGLFGFISGVEFKLIKKTILKRKVENILIKDLSSNINNHIQAGCLNFEVVLNVDETSNDFLQTGIISSYFPIDADPKTIQFESYHDSYFDKLAYKESLFLLKNNKAEKLKLRTDSIKNKNELYYWSNQIIPYYPIEKHLPLANLLFPEYKNYYLIKHTYYIPIDNINLFLNKLSSHKICREFNLINATLSITKKDEESFLFWSNQDYVALDLHFHITHSIQSLISIKEYLTELTDLIIQLNGNFGLGDMQCFEKNQLLKCYPQMPDFLNLKLKHDPSEIIQTNWYQSIKKIIYGSSKTDVSYLSTQTLPLQKRGSSS